MGNLLLIVGLSALVGGLKDGSQDFSPKIAVSNAALLVLP
jgi:Ca2+/H+ antiporter